MLGGQGPYGGVAAPRILIVDDDPNLLVILAEQLRADGYEVQTARDGEEALRRLGQAWPDLLIIDMLLAPAARDGLAADVDVESRLADGLRDDWCALGLELVDASPATAAHVAARPTTWARRLRLASLMAEPDRVAWRIELRRR